MKTSKQRILVLTSSFPRYEGDTLGGGPWVRRLSKELAAQFHLTVLCPRLRDSSITELVDGFQVVRYAQNPFGIDLAGAPGLVEKLKASPWKILLVPFLLISLFLSALKEAKRLRPAAIHAHWVFPQGFVAALMVKAFLKQKPKLILTSHGTDLEKLSKSFLAPLIRFALRKADVVTCVGDPLVQIGKSLAPDAKFDVIPMGVDTDVFKNTEKEPSPTLHFPVLDEKSAVFVFTGNMVEPKGISELVKGFASANRKHGGKLALLLLGDGYERSHLEKAYGPEQHIHWLGRQPQKNLPKIYSHCDAMLFPSHREGLGLSVVEALACGLPVLTNKLPVFNSLANLGLPQFEKLKSPESIELAIETFLCHRSAFESKKDEYRNFVQENYSWQRISERFAQLLLDPR